MAFKKSFNEIIGTVLVLSALLSTASAVDCHGKSFHCVNSTHFMICVDLGGGISQTIDNFLIPCPTPTVCRVTNHFECEFPAPTTVVTTLNVISETTQPWEDVVVTTNSPQRKTTKEYSEKYVNTESLSITDSFTTDTTVDYTTEVPLSSAPVDLNNINVTESVSIVPESSIYETNTTVDTITEPILIYGTTTNLDQVVNAENITAEVITEIPQRIPENTATGAIEVTTEIPLVAISTQIIPDNITTGAGEAITEIPHEAISTVEAIISIASEIPQILPENITTGAGEAITEIPLVEIATVETIIINASDIPEIIPEKITTGTGEAITEIPLVEIATVEAIISNASDIPEIIPENITTGAGEEITEIPLVDISTVEAIISNASGIPEIIPENLTTGAGESITEIPLVEIATVEAIISNASHVPEIIPENITTGAGEAITEIPLVEIATVEAIISNTSDIPQILPENITTGAGEAITEIPLVEIATVEAIISNASDIPEIIPDNITTGAEEAITNIPLVDKSTTEAIINNVSDIPHIIPENITTGAREAITEVSPVVKSTTEAIINNVSDIPNIIPENITTGAREEITEVSPIDISTGEAFISNASGIPEIIPENITAGTGEAITEIPLVEIATVEAIISNASHVPEIIPENIPTGADEAITNIPLVDKSTTEAIISNASDIPQIVPENITTGAREAITEIPLVEIATVEAIISNASEIPQILPENITTGAGEAITEIPLVEIATVETIIINASDIPEIIPENITTGAEEAITNISLVEIATVEAIISNASEIPQILPENITTGAGEAITEIPLVEIATVETIIINASDIPEIIPENITTGAEEAITNISLVEKSTTEAIISNASEIPQILPENITTGAGEAITEIPLVEIATVETIIINASDIPEIIPENITTGAEEAITNISLVEKSTTEAIISNASEIPQILPENITTGAGEAITEIPLVEIATVETIIINASDIPEIIPENITTGTGEAITEIPLVEIATVEAIISKASDIPEIIPENIPTGAGEEITEIPLVDISTVEAIISNASVIPQIISENITTGAGEAITDISHLEIATVGINNIVPEATPSEISANNFLTQMPENTTETTDAGANTNNLTDENIITSLQNKTRTETNETTINQEERMSTTESGLFKDNSETKETNTTVADLPTGENKTDTNILANNIVDTVISKAEISTEKPTSAISDKNLQTVANEITTEKPLLSASYDHIQNVTGGVTLGTEKNTLISENKVIMDSTNLINEKSTQNLTTQFPQDQEASTIESGRVATDQLNINTSDNSILITTEGFDEKLQSPNSTEQPITVTFDEKLQTAVNDNVKTERPIFTIEQQTIRDIIVTTNAVTEKVNQDKLNLSYDSETTMATTVDILIPEIVKTNSPNWGDTTTTYNPLEETEKPASSIFDVNAIQSDLKKEQAMEEVFESSVTTNTPTITNLDYTTTERDSIQKNLPLYTINGGFGSTNQNEQETIGSNINVKKTILTNEKENISEINFETTTEDNQISTIDIIEIQENTLGTTESINVIVITTSVTLGAPHKNDVKQIETTIDGANATGQSSQDTEMDSIIPNLPDTETNIISQTNQTSDVSIAQLGTNIRTDAINYTTVAVDNFSSTDKSVTESTNLSVNSDLGRIDNNIIPQQSQTTSESIDKGKSNLLETDEGSTNSNQIISDSQANTITNKLNQDSKDTNVAGILITNDKPTTENLQANTINKLNQDSKQTNVQGTLVTNVSTDDNTSTTESNNGQTSIKVNSGLDIIENNIINEQSDKRTLNVVQSIEGSTNSNQIISNTEQNAINQLNQDLEQTNATGNLVTDALNEEKTTIESNKDQISSNVNSQLDTFENNIVNQQSQTTSESIDKGTSNVLKSIEVSTNSNQIISDAQANTIIKKSNQDAEQTNIADTSVTDNSNDYKTTTESSNGPTITKAYPQSINDNTSKDITITAAFENENLPSTGLKNSDLASDLADDVHTSNIINGTTKTVNISIDNHNVPSSSVSKRNNETKYTVLENIQNALHIGNFFIDTASQNSTRAISHINNEALTENTIHVSEVMTEANTATESETALDSTVFNNLQVSRANEIVTKLDANLKSGSIESALVNKGQNIEIKNINKPVAHIVPFDGPSGLTNNADDQETANIKVSKTIMSVISPVMEPATLDILTTKTIEIGSDGTTSDNEGDILSTYIRKVNKIEITTESYKPVISDSAIIISRTTSMPNNLVQNLPLPAVVTEAENIPYIVDPKEVAFSSTSEKTIKNGVRPDIAPVFVNINTNLNEKPNVEKAIARENIARNIRPISTLIPGNSVTEVNNILQSTDITSSITDSTFDGSTPKYLSITSIKPVQIPASAQKASPSTYETNSGTRNPANVVPENIHQAIVPSNQHSELTGQQNVHVSTVGKEIKTHLITTDAKISSGTSAAKVTIPQNNIQKITSTGTVFLGNNSSAAPKNTSQTETNSIVSVITRNNTIGGNEQKTINLQQNSSVNTTEQFNQQVTSTKKPVHKPNSSLTSTTQASTKTTASKSVSTVTENPKKQVVNNTLNYSCINGVRGRYSDKNDCRKFYICIGNTEPIIGHCPVNTVFSDIKKLCTKNMSHCIRDNEFKCPSDGRFSDVINNSVYYICVNHENHLYRFKFQCQKGFTLNKTTVRCVENKEIESNESVSISSDDVSESSDSTNSTSTRSISTSSSSGSSSSSNASGDSDSNSTKSKQKKEKSEGIDDDNDDEEVFECEKKGKFPVRNDCRRYYLCKRNRKGQYRRKLKKCDSGDVFHKSKKKCVDADDYEC